ncbi:MAG: DUF2752 domain-containing protein [Planctomycetota bacterium]|jgi:hypothetical protein
MLVVSCGVVVLALLLQVRSDQRVAFRGLAQYPLPHTCTTRILFDIECPGCGLTRSVIRLAQGSWQASLTAHRLGWLMAAAVLVQFPYRIVALRRIDTLPLGKFTPKWFGRTLIFLLIANWLVKTVW